MPEVTTATDTTRRDATDVARGVAAAARRSKWRLCSACGELGVPPGWSGVACWFCTPVVPVPFPDQVPSSTARQERADGD